MDDKYVLVGWRGVGNAAAGGPLRARGYVYTRRADETMFACAARGRDVYKRLSLSAPRACARGKCRQNKHMVVEIAPAVRTSDFDTISQTRGKWR